MGCNNCLNGCIETTSDKCIKYTGVDVPTLGISKGDSINVVIEKLVEAIDQLQLAITTTTTTTVAP